MAIGKDQRGLGGQEKYTKLRIDGKSILGQPLQKAQSGMPPGSVGLIGPCQPPIGRTLVEPMEKNPREAALELELGRELSQKEKMLLHHVQQFEREYCTEGVLKGPWLIVETVRGQKAPVFNVTLLAEDLKQDLMEYEGLKNLQMGFGVLNPTQHHIMSHLEETMTAMSHHTTLHGEIMGRYAQREMKSQGMNRSLSRLSYLVGLSHDVVQDMGPKNNEFESAYKLMDELHQSSGWKERSQSEKKRITRFVYQAICSFTTLDFAELKTYGEKALESIADPEVEDVSLLSKFGRALAHNELFSKIEFLGNPDIFAKLVPNHGLDENQCKMAVLLSQMFQMCTEFKTPFVRPIHEELNKEEPDMEKVKAAIITMIESETRPKDPENPSQFPGFWRDGMPPATEMKRQLNLGDRTVREMLLEHSDTNPFLDISFKLIEVLTQLGNPNRTDLIRIFGHSWE